MSKSSVFSLIAVESEVIPVLSSLSCQVNTLPGERDRTLSVRSLCPVNGWQELMVGHSREVAPSSRPTDPPALLLFHPRREVFWGKAGRERHVKSSESRARLMLRGVSIRVSGPRRGRLARVQDACGVQVGR